MRILIATHASLEVGGGEELMLMTLAEALTQRGHDVRIANFASTFGGERRTSLGQISRSLPGIDVVSVPGSLVMRRILPIPGLRGVRVLCDSFRWADVIVFGQYYGFDLSVWILSRIAGRPVVCSQSNALFRSHRGALRDAAQEGYARTIGWRVLRRCDAVRVGNLDDLKFLQAHGYSHGLLLYPMRGEFSTAVRPQALPPPNDRLAEKLEADVRFKVMTAGRMTHQKGVEVIAQLIRLLHARRPEAHREIAFYFAGTADLPPEIERVRSESPELVVNLGVLPRAIFALFLMGSDVVLVPSLYESFGMIAAEAQSFGKPVIATDITGLREVVTDGTSGILVREWTAEAFLEAILNLRTIWNSDSPRWEAMKAQAMINYQRVLGPDVQNAQFDGLLAELERLGKRSRDESSE